MRIAVLGLGRMGRALTPHLLAGGHQVVVFNRTDTAGRAANLDGAVVAASAAEAVADAEAVITVLFGPDTVRDVVTNGDLPFPAGALWIDVTTIAPPDAAQFATWSRTRDIRYVHAPLVGSLAPARAGTLGVLLGGPADDVAEASHITAAWADPSRIYRFPTAAQAAAAKLLINVGLAVVTQGLAEAISVGSSAGLGLPDILAVLDRTPLAGLVAVKGETVQNRTFTQAQFTVDALAKDAALATASTPIPLPALRAAQLSLSRQQEAGHGDWDFSVIAAASG